MLVQSIISILWLAFVAFWIVSAVRYHRPGATTSWRKGAWVRLIAAVLFIGIFRLINNGLTFSTQSNTAIAWVGVIVAAAGIAVAFWARVSLAGSWGMPMAESTTPKLVTSGVYRWIRHPIYSGMLLAMAGTALAVSYLVFLPFLILASYFIYSAIQEEHYLTAKLGPDYESYRRRTKMLVPFVF